MPAMPSQSFTFFFTVDTHRATDHSQTPTWSSSKSTSSAPPQALAWVAPRPA